MTSTRETPMSLFGRNKCGKTTIKQRELDLFFILHFTYWGGGAYGPNAPPVYGPDEDFCEEGARSLPQSWQAVDVVVRSIWTTPRAFRVQWPNLISAVPLHTHCFEFSSSIAE